MQKYKLGSKALIYVYSRAIDYMTNSNFVHSTDPLRPKALDDPSIQRTYCFMKATIDYLRNQDLLAHPVEFKEKVGSICQHSVKNLNIQNGICTRCKCNVHIMIVPKPEKP